MTNREYTALVDKGEYPESPIVPLDVPFENQNGAIQNLLLEKFTSAALIISRPGSIRANHYHKTDWHYTYVIEGAVEYYWRKVGSKEQPKWTVVGPGQLFFTPPMVEHAMCFIHYSVVMTFAKNIRDTEHHEDDVVRVPLKAKEWDPQRGEFKFVTDPKCLSEP